MSDQPYRIVIGLEVHVQLLTRSKMFCGCKNQFGLPPNSATCPVCIGMPGVLPVMNRQAFELSLKAALALNCQIASFTKWDRKNYYYPDLPKNFQISQYDLPFSHDGWLDITTAAGPKRIRIIRAHLEEDAGKLLHDEEGGGRESLVDLNRTGTPLLEIVSHPDMASPEEAKAYLEEIRLLLKELEISDCEMQEGSLRCDANVNIHIPQKASGDKASGDKASGDKASGDKASGDKASGGSNAPGDDAYVATPIVEVKNLNSFRAVERAMKYEAQRQYEEFQKTGKKFGEVPKATAGWDESRGITVIQRRKEEASDYRYFPEPDLVPVEVDAAWVDRVRASLGELPSAQRGRLQSQYSLSAYDANVLTSQGRATVSYFETVAQKCGDAKSACNWIANKLLASAKDRSKESTGPFAISADHLAELIAEQKSMGLTKQITEEVFDLMLAEGLTARDAIGRKGIKSIGSADELIAIVRKAIAANPKAVADFKKGKVAAAQSIKGAVMKETKGAAKPDLVQQIVMDELQKA